MIITSSRSRQNDPLLSWRISLHCGLRFAPCERAFMSFRISYRKSAQKTGEWVFPKKERQADDDEVESILLSSWNSTVDYGRVRKQSFWEEYDDDDDDDDDDHYHHYHSHHDEEGMFHGRMCLYGYRCCKVVPKNCT